MKFNLVNALTALFVILSLGVSWLGWPYIGLSLAYFSPTELVTFPFGSFSGIVDIALTAFFFWLTLSTLLIRFSQKQLALLFFSATLFIGSLTLALLWLTASPFMLAGPAPLIYCLLTTLLISDPNLQIRLLGLLPLQPKVLVIILLGLNLIQNLGQGAYIQVAACLSGVLYAFFYTFFLKKGAHKLR